MDFEIFKKHIERIQQTEEKEEILSKCIEDNLATSTRCIIDISGDVIVSVIELLADYYDCYYEIQGVSENDISWWLYSEDRILYINDEKLDLKKLWTLDLFTFDDVFVFAPGKELKPIAKSAL